MVQFRTIDLKSRPIAQFMKNHIIQKKMHSFNKINKLVILKDFPVSGIQTIQSELSVYIHLTMPRVHSDGNLFCGVQNKRPLRISL